MKRPYTIALNGCDDRTVFDVELNKVEFALFKKLSFLSEQHSKCHCQPTLSLKVGIWELDPTVSNGNRWVWFCENCFEAKTFLGEYPNIETFCHCSLEED
jgi:hypothetical protein